MTNETHRNFVFNVEDCRAKKGPPDLVDCLSPNRAYLCGTSLAFGHGYFCKHPRRKEIIELTEKLRIKLMPPSDIP